MNTGLVLEVVEDDYLYGAGVLRIKVERIDRIHPVRYADDDWYPVEGTQLGYNGVELGYRTVLVRARRIPQRPST